MNEIIFFLHIIIVIGFCLVALKLGKNALIATICLQAVLANMFVVKQMNLFGLSVTCSDVFIVGSFLGLNLLQEYFGKEEAKKAIWINFFVIIFYLVMSQFQIFYVPNSYDFTHNSFLSILNFMPRITIASILAYFFTQRVDLLLYAFLKKLFLGKYLVLRNIFSIFCTQFLDTVLFSFMGLYGIVGSVWNIIIVSFTIKVIVIFIAVPFSGFSKKIMNGKTIF